MAPRGPSVYTILRLLLMATSTLCKNPDGRAVSVLRFVRFSDVPWEHPFGIDLGGLRWERDAIITIIIISARSIVLSIHPTASHADAGPLQLADAKAGAGTGDRRITMPISTRYPMNLFVCCMAMLLHLSSSPRNTGELNLLTLV